MPQHVAVVSSLDIDRILLRDYSGPRLLELREAICATDVVEKDRVVAACMKIANGSAERLLKELRDAPGYYREILSEAEYPKASRKWSTIQKLADAQQQHVYDQDRQQYELWFHRVGRLAPKG